MQIRLETSKRSGIDNYQGSEISNFNLNWSRELSKKFPRAIIRSKESSLYNCHGLTFANRRTSIIRMFYINLILKDDQYDEIPMASVLAGDVVIYYSDQGDPNHSGIVVEYSSQLITPIIYSKWGNGGEFIHALNHCPNIYGPIYKFYRCKL